jgi:hypothetical protein
LKSFRKWIALTALTLCAFVAAHGQLDNWVENIEAGHQLEAVFFRQYPLPTGSAIARRPAKETRVELSKLIDQTPAGADFYSLRALEAEQQLDFAAAEGDWKKYVSLAKDKSAANLTLADYYHRRLRPAEEIPSRSLNSSRPGPPSAASPPSSTIRASNPGLPPNSTRPG